MGNAGMIETETGSSAVMISRHECHVQFRVGGRGVAVDPVLRSKIDSHFCSSPTTLLITKPHYRSFPIQLSSRPSFPTKNPPWANTNIRGNPPTRQSVSVCERLRSCQAIVITEYCASPPCPSRERRRYHGGLPFRASRALRIDAKSSCEHGSTDTWIYIVCVSQRPGLAERTCAFTSRTRMRSAPLLRE